MKRIYSIILAAILGFAGLTAKGATIEFTLVVDNAERVVAQTMSTGFLAMPKIVELADGENLVTAYCESTFNILASDAGYVIKSVTINGASQTIDDPARFVFYVPFDFAGSEVVVTTALAGEDPGVDPSNPDDPQVDPQPENCEVTFEFADEASRAYIVGASIYNEPVSDFINGFEVAKGTPVELQLNTDLTTDVFTVNGVAPMVIMGTTLFTVDANTVVYVKVHQNIDYHFTVNIDNADLAEVGYWEVVGTGWFAQRYFRAFPLVDGVNELSVNESVATQVCVRAKGDTSSVVSITVNGESVEVEPETMISLAEGMVIDIATASRSRDAVCTVVCDDFTKVKLMCGSTPVDLTAATQQVYFFSDTESTFVFTPNGYSDRIWSVTLNGKPVAESNGQYVVEGVANGDVIDVVTQAADVTVSFAYADELSRSAISYITVNENGFSTQLSGFDGESFTVPQGAYVSVFINSDMLIEEFTVTGSDLIVYPGSYEFSVAGNTEIFIKAVEKVKTKVSIDIEKAEYAKVYYIEHTTNWIGVPVDKEVTIDLADGENTIAFYEVPSVIYVAPIEGAQLIEVSVDGESLLDTEADGGDVVVAVPVVADMKLVVRVEPLSGIEGVLGVAGCADIYNMHGVCIMRHASAADIPALAPGIYIVGGRKVIVR